MISQVLNVSDKGFAGIRVLRAFRVLRLFKVFKYIKVWKVPCLSDLICKHAVLCYQHPSIRRAAYCLCVAGCFVHLLATCQNNTAGI